MPKRVIDFDAMWGSDKLASCAEWAQAEYAWLYGLADASGSFELTNLRVIWGRVAAIRRNLTIERLEQVFGEFQDKGLLFVWEHEGKRYGNWTGSDVPGRLPAPSWRLRLERLAPPVPKQLLAEYVARFSRGRAGLPGGGFSKEPSETESNSRFEISDLKEYGQLDRGSKHEISDFKHPGQSEGESKCNVSGVKSSDERNRQNHLRSRAALSALNDGVEENQAQDWNLDSDLEEGRKKELSAPEHFAACGKLEPPENKRSQTLFSDLSTKSKAERESAIHAESEIQSNAKTAEMKTEGNPERRSAEYVRDAGSFGTSRAAYASVGYTSGFHTGRDKSSLVASELVVGRGPVCGPVRVKPEALERIRQREAARKVSRSP